jgi:cell division protein FtsI/penicillin-binding protein 2
MQPSQRRLRWQPQQNPDDGEPDRGPLRRLTILRLFVVGVFAVLVLQLAHVQIANGYRYKLLAQSNLIKVVPSSSARGLIFDRLGRPLVQNLPVFSATLTPAQLPADHPEDVYYALQSSLGVSAAAIQQQVDDSVKQNGPDTAVTIKSDIDQTTALKLAELR